MSTAKEEMIRSSVASELIRSTSSTVAQGMTRSGLSTLNKENLIPMVKITVMEVKVMTPFMAQTLLMKYLEMTITSLTPKV